MSASRSASQKPRKSQVSVQALSVLNELGQLVTAVQDPSKVLKQIANKAKNVLGADIVDLYEYRQDKNEFILPPIMVGKRWSPDITKDRIYDDDVVVRVVNSGKPQYFSDAQSAKPLTGKFDVPRPDIPDERFVIREGITSSASLPLKAGEEIVGVMFVNYRSRQAFDDEQKNLIETFSELAAIAIHNARLWNAREEQSKSLEQLYAESSRQLDAIEKIVNAIGAASDPLPIILKQTIELFTADYGAIGLFIPQTGEIQFYAIWEDGIMLEGDDIPPDKRSISGEQSIMIRAATVGSVYRASNINHDPFYRKWYPETQSELAIPLRASDENIIGVLNLESKSLDAFSKAGEQLCEGLSNVAASVIEKSNLLKYSRALNQEMNLLHKTVVEQDWQEVLTRVLESLNEIVGAGTSSSINVYDEKRNDFTILARGELAAMLRVPPRPDGTCRYVMKTKQPLYHEDRVNPPIGQPTLREDRPASSRVKSFAAIPLVRNERVLGVLFVHQTNPIRFTSDLRLVLDTFAGQAAIAIDNARVFKEVVEASEVRKALVADLDRNNIRLERRNASFEALTEIGQQLTANIQRGEHEILSIIHQQASRLMDTDNMYIALYEPEKDLVYFELAFLNGQPVDIKNEEGWSPRSGGKGRTEWIIRNKSPKLTYTKKEAEEWYEQPGAHEYIGTKFASWLGVPIMFGDEVLGVIATYNKNEEYKYDPDDMKILSLMGRQAAIALQNARLISKLDTVRELGEDLSSSLSG